MSTKKIPRELIIIFGICLLLLVLSLAGFFNPFRAIAEKSLVIPFKEAIFNWQRTFRKNLNECLLKEEGKIAELKTKVASLTEENLSQKKLLSANVPKNWQFLGAKVIEISGEELTINMGKTDGVKEGMVAIFENTYLGKVVFVSEKIAKVRMPSYFDNKMAIKIVSKNDLTILSKGLLVGKGTEKMKVEQIYYSEQVRLGDLVITDSEGGILIIGEITEVIQNKGEAFKSAGVKLLYQPNQLNTIFLIKGKL